MIAEPPSDERAEKMAGHTKGRRILAGVTLVAVFCVAGAALGVQRQFLGDSGRDAILRLWGLVATLGLVVWAMTSRVLGPDPTPTLGAIVFPTPSRKRFFQALQLAGWSAVVTGLFLLRVDLLSRAGTWFWLIGLLAVVLGLAVKDVNPTLRRWRRETRFAIRPGHAFWLLVGMLTIVAAFVLRVDQLETIPPTFLDDEASVADYGLNVLHQKPLWGQHVSARVTLFRNGATAYPIIGSYVYAAAMQITGETTFGLRLAAAIVGGLSVIVLYVMLLPYVRPWAAVGAAFLLAVSHVDLYWTRSGMSQSLSTTAGIVVLWLVLRGLRSGRHLDFALAGLALGLAQYFYEGARFLVVVLAPFFAYMAISDRHFIRDRWTHVATMVAVSAAVFAPIGLWYLQNPKEFLERSETVLVFAHPDYLAATYPGMNTAEIVVEQIRRGLDGLAYRGDGSGAFYSMRVPLLDPVAGALLLLGIFGFSGSVRRPERVLVTLWLWVPALVACAITIDPPPMTRLILVVPAFFFIVGVVLDRVGRLLERVGGRFGLGFGMILWLVALGYGAAWNYRIFFVDYPRLLPVNLATAAGNLAREMGPSYKSYVVGPPHLYFFSPTGRFLARGLAGEDLRAEDIPVRERGRRNGLFIVVPPFAEALARLRVVYPNGRAEEHHDATGRLLFTSYEVAAAEINAAAGSDAPWLEFDSRFGRQGRGTGEFQDARALAVDPDGHVYVADGGNARIDVFDASGSPVAIIGEPGTADGQFRQISGIALAPDGSVLGLDRETRMIQRFDRSGKWLGKLDGSTLFEEPVGLAVAADGDVLVVDRGKRAVYRLAPDGTLRSQVGGKGTGSGEFEKPSAIAVAPDGRVYVADPPGGRLQRFSGELEYEGEWPIPPAAVEVQGGAVAVGEGGRAVYVADPSGGRVDRYTPEGRRESAVGEKGDRLPRQFLLPRAVAVDRRGNVYVLDSMRNQIFRFDIGRVQELADAPRP